MIKYGLSFSLLVLIVFLFSFSCRKDAGVKTYKTQYVIIIVVDGARYTETWGFPGHQFIPNRSAMLNRGAMCSSFYNDGYTFTNAGHTAMTTGFYQLIDNSGAEYPDKPSFFQFWLKRTKYASTDAWVISTKDKLEVLSDCKDADWKGQYRPNTDCGINGLGSGYREDSVTFNRVQHVLATYHPHLILVNFKQPDAAAHAADSLAYLQGIVDTDKYIKIIWDQIQNDNLYKDKTTLIVTNDHGRHTAGHLDGYISHSDYCDGCKHIEFLGIGPDFKENYICTKSYSQNDIANTVAELLGFRMPLSDGSVMHDIFK